MKRVNNYDLEEISSSKYAFNHDCIKTCKLTFQDDDFFLETIVEISGNIAGCALIDFCIDKVLEDNDYTLWVPDTEGNHLIIDDRIELEVMLVGFKLMRVKLKK